MRQLDHFWRNESGATSIEYALITGLIALVIVTALTAMGPKLNTKFNRISNALN